MVAVAVTVSEAHTVTCREGTEGESGAIAVHIHSLGTTRGWAVVMP